MYRYLLFDLDGTLTDSGEGIFNSLRYAFEKLSLPVPPDSRLRSFVGPPLQESFRSCGMDDGQIQKAIFYFRELYEETGKFQNVPAAGMAEMLAELKERGYIMALASSKVQIMCDQICERFGFAPSLAAICGSPVKGDLTKADVIRNTMAHLGLTQEQVPEILMVGDRKYDVLGAKECGIDCIGVEFFGYAAPGELQEAGAVAVVKTPEELKQFILEQGAF